MKKVMLFALSCAFLTACSAEKVADPNELSTAALAGAIFKQHRCLTQ